MLQFILVYSGRSRAYLFLSPDKESGNDKSGLASGILYLLLSRSMKDGWKRFKRKEVPPYFAGRSV